MATSAVGAQVQEYPVGEHTFAVLVAHANDDVATAHETSYVEPQHTIASLAYSEQLSDGGRQRIFKQRRR